jgi:hypothetical protein
MIVPALKSQKTAPDAGTNRAVMADQDGLGPVGLTL